VPPHPFLVSPSARHVTDVLNQNQLGGKYIWKKNTIKYRCIVEGTVGSLKKVLQHILYFCISDGGGVGVGVAMSNYKSPFDLDVSIFSSGAGIYVLWNFMLLVCKLEDRWVKLVYRKH
jgi:hypothetical protein